MTKSLSFHQRLESARFWLARARTAADSETMDEFISLADDELWYAERAQGHRRRRHTPEEAEALARVRQLRNRMDDRSRVRFEEELI